MSRIWQDNSIETRDVSQGRVSFELTQVRRDADSGGS